MKETALCNYSAEEGLPVILPFMIHLEVQIPRGQKLHLSALITFSWTEDSY